MPPARHESVVSLTEAPDAGRSTSPARFRSFSELDAMDVDDLATPPPFPDHVEHPSPTASETAVRRSSSTPPDAADPDIIDLTFEAPVEPPSDEPQINIDFNPKIKAIKNELVIPFDIFAERYARIGGHRLYPIALDPEFRDKPTTRKVISGLYGGNPQEAFPRPSKQKIARHGIRDFMCLNYDWHPNAPKFPGAPGFYFAVGDVHAEDCDVGLKSGPHRLITKFEPAKWQYLGQYRAIPSKSLTKEEWMSLSNKVTTKPPTCKDTWIDGILKSSWGVRIREKIAYAHGLNDNPSKEDIMSAFDSGEMFIAVWGMKCVDYDEAFQLSLPGKHKSLYNVLLTFELNLNFGWTLKKFQLHAIVLSSRQLWSTTFYNPDETALASSQDLQ
ncbi:hypothetical protein ONZ45_g14633 [Pleurotus djamor]|nr:hypothetical protein ONZ45_g14633 [Pleurotus djamor]